MYVADLDAAGELVSFGTATLEYPVSGDEPDIKGIEFSPNGNYVYLIHDITSINPSPFKIYDVAAQSFIMPNSISAAFVNQIPNYQFSRIELGSDGKLYLANANGLATLSNPNNPSGLSWNGSAIPVGYNLSDYNYPQAGNNVLRAFNLPDQIDDMDYTQSFFIDTECCIQNNVYDVAETDATHEYSVSATWSNGNNPFNNTSNAIRVKDKMVIKTGTNITAYGMVFEFAPDAQLIIENGARFTINNTILTVDTRCDAGVMWHGVEVWGGGSSQYYAGKLIGQGASVIEHALEAVANYKHDVTNNTIVIGNNVVGSNGGVISFIGTTLRNNQYDIYMQPFQASFSNGLLNDQTAFTNCNFITDAALNNPAILPIEHARLNGVNGVRFQGSKFQNTTNPSVHSQAERGVGIQSYDSKFTVNHFPPYTSEFNNLSEGIRAESTNPLNTTKINNTAFYNNWRSVFLRGLNLADASDNTFNIGTSYNNTVGGGVSFGLTLNRCDGYKVENNDFFTSFDGYLGVGVIHSGEGANEIYKNTFTDLQIGSQAQEINGDNVAFGGKGLEFRCNKYTNSYYHDIWVSSGIIKSIHGQCVNILSPSNNQFSYTTIKGDFWLSSTINAGVSYQMSFDNTYNTVPRNYSNSPPIPTHYNPNNTFPTFCSTEFYPAGSCPTRNGKKVLGLRAEISSMQIVDEDLVAQIDGGDTQGLLNLIATTSGDFLKDELLANSPYLSDEVILSYIASSPSHGNLKQVLLVNSPLSDAVSQVVAVLSLPNGIRNAIANAQTGISPRQELELEIAYCKSVIERADNDVLRELLFDDTPQATNLKDVADYIETEMVTSTNKEAQLLVDALIGNKEYVEAQQKLTQIDTNPINSSFCKLKNTVIAYQQLPDNEMEIVNNAVFLQDVNDVATSSSNCQSVVSAKVLKERIGLSSKYNEFIEMGDISTGPNSRMAQNEEEEKEVNSLNKINVYPNPTKEQFTITHNMALELGDVSLEIYDIMGKSVLQQIINTKENIVNINSLKAGIYFYAVTQNGDTIKKDKLIVR